MIKYILLASILFSAVFGQQCTGTCSNNNDAECALIANTFCNTNVCATKLDNGAACNRAAQCVSGFCNANNVCAQKRYAGCQCAADADCLSNACVNNACASGSLRGGAACTVNAQCFSASCVNGTCAGQGIGRGTCLVTACPAGQACISGGCVILKNAGESCGGANGFCNSGLYCDGLADGVCRTPLAAGAACTVVSGINPCVNGFFCNGTFANANGTCIASTAAGQSCTLGTTIDPCDTTSSCNGTTCNPTTCSFFKNGTNCADGRICALAQCVFIPQSRAAGQVCDNNFDCSGVNVCFGTAPNRVCTVPAAAGSTCNSSIANLCSSKDGSGCSCAATGANTPTTCSNILCGSAGRDTLSRCVANAQCGPSDFQCILNNCGAAYQASVCCGCSAVSGAFGNQQLPISGTCSAGFSFTPCCPGAANPGTCGTPTGLCTPPAPAPDAASSTIVSFVVLAVALVLALAF